MLYTEETARANIRNREGERVFYLGKGDTLTPGARDFLLRQRVQIRPAEEAKPGRYRLLGGGWVEEKPEQLTHLNSEVLVRKDHPRILFRGKMDSLQGMILLCQLHAQPVRRELEELLALSRQIIRCDVLDEMLEETSLCGLTQEQLRQHSHRPQEHYGQPHFMPSWQDGEQILWINALRCVVREAECAAVRAWQDADGNPTRPDILRALNRMSSMVYILMIRLKKEG